MKKILTKTIEEFLKIISKGIMWSIWIAIGLSFRDVIMALGDWVTPQEKLDKYNGSKEKIVFYKKLLLLIGTLVVVFILEFLICLI